MQAYPQSYDRAPMSDFLINLLERGLQDVRNRNEAEELSCLLVELSKDKGCDSVWRLSEVLLLRTAIVHTLNSGVRINNFEQLLCYFEKSFGEINEQPWQFFEVNTSDQYRAQLLAGLWARLRYLGLARAENNDAGVIIKLK